MSQLRVGKRTVPWAEERAPKVDVCRLATPRRGLVQACCGARIRQREQRKKHSQQLGHTQFNSSTNKLSVLRARESICPGLCLTFCLSHCVVSPHKSGLGQTRQRDTQRDTRLRRLWKTMSTASRHRPRSARQSFALGARPPPASE